jgi:hypothetical protein
VGANPRLSACSTVVSYWLRLFRETKGKNHDADVKKLLPPLDIGSHINAGAQPRPKAEARNERTLEAVACTPWFGVGLGRELALPTPTGPAQYRPLLWPPIAR